MWLSVPQDDLNLWKALIRGDPVRSTGPKRTSCHVTDIQSVRRRVCRHGWPRRTLTEAVTDDTHTVGKDNMVLSTMLTFSKFYHSCAFDVHTASMHKPVYSCYWSPVQKMSACELRKVDLADHVMNQKKCMTSLKTDSMYLPGWGRNMTCHRESTKRRCELRLGG